MCRATMVGSVAMAVSLACWPAAAAESPLEGIPDTAVMLVRLKSPEATIKKVADFAGRIKEDYRTLVTNAAHSLGALISNPEEAGVDRKRDWWLVVICKSGDAADVVFGIPAADEMVMKRALGERFKFASYENWVFYTESEHALAEFEARKAGKRKSASSAFDPRSRELFDKSDLAAYINVHELRRARRKEIDALKMRAKQFIEQLGAADTSIPSPGMDMGAAFKLYADVASGLFQVVEDAEGVACGANLHDNGIDVEAGLIVARSTRTDRFLERNPPSEMKTLGRLPRDKVIYYGLAGDISEVSQWGARVAATMFKGNEKVQKKYAEARKALAGLQLKGQYGTFSIAHPNEGVLWYSTVTEVDQPDKMRDITIQVLEATTKLATRHAITTVAVKPNAERVGDHRVDLVTVKMLVDPAKDPMGISTNFMNIMYGPEGMFTRLSTLPGLLVQSVGGGKPVFDGLMHTLESNQGAAGQPAWATARRGMPAKANGIVLVDAPRLATEVLLVLAELKLPFLSVDGAAIADLQKDLDASYLGIAVANEPHGVRLNVHVPFEQAKGIAKVIEFTRSEVSVGR